MKDLRSYHHIYFLGIGGIGMSAIARFCLQWGLRVSGYDRSRSAITESLITEGASIVFADDPDSIEGQPDLVIYTPAIPADNRIRMHFTGSMVPMVKRSEALEVVTRGIDTIAVAGTHGKTTTSSMISYILSQSGLPHTALLGGVAANYRSNFHSESADLMVVEADEYDRSFWRLYPKWVVVTAMDADHLDIYGTYEEMLDGYRQFLRQIEPDGILVFRKGLKEKIGNDVMGSLATKQVRMLSYGVEDGDYHAGDLRVERGVWHWNLMTPSGMVEDLMLLMPGRHNVENAIAACAIALELGRNAADVKLALSGYKGVSRRFEIRYKDDAHVLVDDYAHHPEELKAAIMAARDTYGGPVTGVFQPHLYSRTRDLAAGFAEAMDMLDFPVLTDIYPAREKPIEGVSAKTILDLMKHPEKRWCQGDSWIEWIVSQAPGILLTLGAGDIDQHIPELIRRMYTNEKG